MFFSPTGYEPAQLNLTPSQFVTAKENASAQELLAEVNSPFTEWEVRNGLVVLVSVDEPALAAHLLKTGHSEAEVKEFLKLWNVPKFNERNQRGFDRLRTRIKCCQDLGARLWGASNARLANIPVGVAMITYVNAGAYAVPTGGSAILMNFGLSYLFDYFNLMHELPPNSADSLARLTRLAKAIFGDESSRGALVTAFPRSIAASEDTKMNSRIRMAMCTLFILLHEYGHIALGHTEQVRSWPRLDILSEQRRREFCAIRRSWEHEADKFALDVLRGKFGADGVPLPSQCFAEMALEDVFGMMTLGMGPSGTTEAPDDTYPTPKNRLFKALGVTSDKEFVERRNAVKAMPADDSRFADELLAPLLVATGAMRAD